jgi:RimJ/RimL family protein N-acetyltransferase
MKLTTKRLILREATLKDAKCIAQGLNNINVSRWLASVPYPYTIKHARNWMKKEMKESKGYPKKIYRFQLELKEKTGIIGGISIRDLNAFEGTATIGYWLNQKYWRQGLTEEAVRRVIDFAFGKLKLRRISAIIFEGNEGSASLARKVGFRLEGTMRESCKCKATGKIHNDTVYGLLRREWKNKAN